MRCFRIETVAIVAMTLRPQRCGPSPCVAFSTSIASCFRRHWEVSLLWPLLPCFSSTLRSFRFLVGNFAYKNIVSPVNHLARFSNNCKFFLPLVRIAALLALRLSLNCLSVLLVFRISFNHSLLVLSALTSFIVVAGASSGRSGLVFSWVLTVTVSPLVFVVRQEMLAQTLLSFLRREHSFKFSDSFTDFGLIGSIVEQSPTE